MPTAEISQRRRRKTARTPGPRYRTTRCSALCRMTHLHIDCSHSHWPGPHLEPPPPSAVPEFILLHLVSGHPPCTAVNLAVEHFRLSLDGVQHHTHGLKRQNDAAAQGT